MRLIDYFRELREELRNEPVFDGVQNPLNSDKRSRTALIFGSIFFMAGLAFLFQGTPLPLVLLEFGYAFFWLTAAFVKLHERVQSLLFKILIAMIAVYYLLKFI